MKGRNVVKVVDDLTQAGLWLRIAGGWAVDAVYGKETRTHQDLDLLVELQRSDDVIERMQTLRYYLRSDGRPSRFKMFRRRWGWVDFHPVLLGDTGAAVQMMPSETSREYPASALAGKGRIGDLAVPCLTADFQLDLRLRYPLRAHDVHDVGRLREIVETTNQA